MKKLFLLLLLLPLVAQAEYHPPIKYGEAKTIYFKLYNTDGTLDVNEADGGAEITADCDGTPTNPITNDFADEGAFYSIALTAGETTCGIITLTIAATDTNVVIIPTFGHPSAGIVSYHQIKAAGLVDAAGTTTTLELATGDSEADDFYNDYWGAIVAGTGLGQEFVITDYANTGNVATITLLVTNTDATSYYHIYSEKKAVVNITSGVIEAKVMSTATDAITATSLQADSIGASELATDAIGSAEIGTAAIDADAIAASAIGASELATDAIGAAEIATDAIGAAELAADAATEIIDRMPMVMETTTIATLASQVSFTLTAGSADDDAYNGCGAIITDVSTAVQKAYGGIQDYAGGTKTVTLDADPAIFTMAATDLVDLICLPSTVEFMNKSEVLGVGSSGDKWRGN